LINSPANALAEDYVQVWVFISDLVQHLLYHLVLVSSLLQRLLRLLNVAVEVGLESARGDVLVLLGP